MKLIMIACNHNSTCTKLENLDDIFNQGQKIASFVSSVSARKLKCPSSARLGTFIAGARSSRKIPARTHLYYIPIIKMH